MEFEEQGAEIRDLLARLHDYATLSDFSRVFYRLIWDWVKKSGEGERALQTALVLLLRTEVRRHGAVRRIAKKGKLDLAALVRIARDTKGSIERLERFISTFNFRNDRQAVIKHLLTAECRYHLGENGEVVAELRKAIDLGCRHPIVQFALGYNLYCHAVRTCVPLPFEGTSAKQFDREGFTRLCREAIEAFRGGLGGQPFDAQLHWWIGLLSESLDSREEARVAFQQAMEIDPEHFGDNAREKIRAISYPVADAMSEEESVRLASLPPISGDDLRQAAAVLRDMRSPPKDVFGA